MYVPNHHQVYFYSIFSLKSRTSLYQLPLLSPPLNSINIIIIHCLLLWFFIYAVSSRSECVRTFMLFFAIQENETPHIWLKMNLLNATICKYCLESILGFFWAVWFSFHDTRFYRKRFFLWCSFDFCFQFP